MSSIKFKQIVSGLFVLTIASALSSSWFSCYQHALKKIFGKDSIDQPWFCFMSSLLLTGIAVLLILAVPTIDLGVLGIPTVC